MIRKILITVTLFFGFVSIAQQGTSSPYSFYGIGDIKFKGSVENHSMGGLSVFKDSIHLNLQNPASFSELKLTTFSVGGNYNNNTISAASANESAKRTSLDYLAVGLPFGKYAVSFGVIPYSSVGYKIQSINAAVTEQNTYGGTGGINKVFAGAAYNLNENWSIGATFEYNFGKITSTSTFTTSNYQSGTQEINTSNGHGANVVAGLMYQSKFKGKMQYFGALSFRPESTITFDNQRIISTLPYVTGNTIITLDGDAVKSTLNLSNKVSIGFGLGHIRKWQIGTEFIWQQSSNFGNRFNFTNNTSYENGSKIIIGGFYIPKFNSYTNYFQRVTYRGGLNYQNTGLVINGKSIKEQNISLGLGLPLTGTFSNLNIGFEFGKRGTRLAGLIQENYTNLSIGLSFNDKWFVKRRFD